MLVFFAVKVVLAVVCYFRSSFELMAPKIAPAAPIHGPIRSLSVCPSKFSALMSVIIITMTDMKKAMADVTVASCIPTL